MAHRLLRRVLAVIVIAAVSGFVFVSMGSPATSSVTWSSTLVPNLSNLGTNVSFTAESCPNVGFCKAVGDSQPQSPTAPLITQPIVATLSGGQWTSEALPAPAAPASPASWSTLTLTGISCTSDSSCTAVGNATTTDTPAGTPAQFGFAEVLAGGTWRATALISPTNATEVSMSGISCVSATACIAVGSGELGQKPVALAYSLFGSAPWSGPHVFPNPSPTFRTMSLSSVSCTSANACVAVGTFFGTLDAQEPLIEQLSGVTWTPETALLPIDATSASLTGVSCANAFACQAVGTVTESSGVQALVEGGTGGNVLKWADTEPVGGEPSSSLLGVACASATSCTAVGSFLDATGVTHSLVESLSAQGSWSTTTGIDPSGPSTSSLVAVSCPLGSCVAVGDASVTDSSTGVGGIAPFAAVESGSTVALLVGGPPTANVGSPVMVAVRALGPGGTSYGGTVVFTSSDPAAVLPPPSTLTNGFGMFAVTFETPGAQTVTATDSVDSSITGTSVAILVTRAKPPPPPPPPPPPSSAHGTTSGGRLFAGVPNGGGYWLTSPTGGVFSYDGAQFYGSLAGVPLNQPIVGMASTPNGGGYWLVASDGGVFSFGDAQFYGSTGAIRLNQPIVGMAPTPNGGGYWLVASDGGIFSFGDAQFYGSTGAIHLNEPVVDMAATADGRGYWMVASDGGIFAFGDAPFLGSLGNIAVLEPIVGMATTRNGWGYYMVGVDGGVYAEGDAVFDGSLGNKLILWPILGITATPNGGYSVVDESGSPVHFG